MSGRPGDEPTAFEVLTRERLGGSFRPLERIALRHASLTGADALEVTREIMRAGTAAVVIPYDPATDRIVVIRQFRIGAALATPHGAALELPAGLVDDGEEEEAAARRELLEETGLKARAIGKAFAILSSPGLCDERAVFFLALVDASALPATAGLANEHEEIVPLSLPADDLVAAADEGRIANGFLFASLQWFARRGRDEAARLSADGQAKGRR